MAFILLKKFLDVILPLCKRGIEGDFRVKLEKQNKSGDFKQKCIYRKISEKYCFDDLIIAG